MVQDISGGAAAGFSGTYRIAGRLIGVSSLFGTVHAYCRDYAAEGIPDFTVTVTPEDIIREKEKTDAEYRREGLPPPSFPADLLETTAVYRRIAERMPDYGTVVFHGSAIAADGRGYLFTAKSGTGKSTHTRLWRSMLGDRAVMINDDKPMLRITEHAVNVCGTPYTGKHRLGCNLTVPLQALCLLTRGETNCIERITKQQAYPMLLQQVYRPQDPRMLQKTLRLIDLLAGQTALYRLACNTDPAAAEIAYAAMKG